MWTKELQHVGRVDEVNTGAYKGLAVYAAPRIHQVACDFVMEAVPDKNARILVLGAGSGAFDERLYDMGYKNITACEYNKEVYKGRFPLVSLDLNEDFSSIGSFDCVVALELIEHLENHFHFLRNCYSLLTIGGAVIISTPNVESSLSRLKFFLRGDLNYFSRHEMLHTGHINPVFKEVLIYYAEYIGFMTKKVGGNSSVWNLGQYQSLVQKVTMVILYIISLVERNKDSRQIGIYSFIKK